MIRSWRDPKLKELRRLRRGHAERCLLEGPHLAAEAVALGLTLERVFVTPEFMARADGQRLVAGLPLAPDLVAAELLASVTDSDSPRGIVAVAALPRGGAGELPTGGEVYLFAEGIQDPGNLGALARVAEAAGVAGLALAAGSASPNHARALRASAGSLLRLPVAVDVLPGELDRRVGAAVWVGLVAEGGRSLWEMPLEGHLILAVGAEGPGLSAELRHHCRAAVTVPLAAPVESLNVTVAAAVVLYEVVRRHGASAD